MFVHLLGFRVAPLTAAGEAATRPPAQFVVKVVVLRSLVRRLVQSVVGGSNNSANTAKGHTLRRRPVSQSVTDSFVGVGGGKAGEGGSVVEGGGERIQKRRRRRRKQKQTTSKQHED